MSRRCRHEQYTWEFARLRKASATSQHHLTLLWRFWPRGPHAVHKTPSARQHFHAAIHSCTRRTAPIIRLYHSTHNLSRSASYTMPPSAPTPISASSTHFSLHHPVERRTLRPKTWLALETLIEFVVVSYLIWALFYLIYLWTCGAVWTAKRLRDLVGRRSGGKKWREERRAEKMKEEATEANEEHSALSFQEKNESRVHDDEENKPPKDTGTHGDNTGRG